MSGLVFEIGTEEIPARFVQALVTDLKDRVIDALKQSRLWHTDTQVQTLAS